MPEHAGRTGRPPVHRANAPAGLAAPAGAGLAAAPGPVAGPAAGPRPVAAVDPGELVLANLGLVQHLVNQLSVRYPPHVDRRELWNAGAFGLVEAAGRYRPETGVPFPRYAASRIRGAIIDSTRDRDWITRSARRSLRELERREHEFEREHGRMPRDRELAGSLGMDPAELRALRESAVRSSLLHLDHGPDDERSHRALREAHPDYLPEEAFERRELAGTLRTAVANLPPVQRDVIRRYFFEGEMLQAIARSMRLTEARVSQICSEAVNAIRAYLATLYEGVPEVPSATPGKRARAAYVSQLRAESTWRERIAAAEAEWGRGGTVVLDS